MFNSEQANPLYPSSTELPVLIDKYDGQVIEDTDEVYSLLVKLNGGEMKNVLRVIAGLVVFCFF